MLRVVLTIASLVAVYAQGSGSACQLDVTWHDQSGNSCHEYKSLGWCHKGKATDAYVAVSGTFPIEDMKETISGRTVFQGCCNCDWDLPAQKVVVKETAAAADTKPAGEL